MPGLAYLSAFALVSLKGKPTKEAVSAVITASGATVDKAELDYVFAQTSNKSIDVLIAEGAKKMSASAGSSSAAPAAAAAPAAKADAKPAADKKEDKKAAKPAADEDDDLFGGGLF